MKLKFYVAAGFLFITFFLSCVGIDKDDGKAKLNYKNDRYSFALTFPENWKNYVVFEKTGYYCSRLFSGHTPFCFAHKIQKLAVIECA